VAAQTPDAIVLGPSLAVVSIPALQAFAEITLAFRRSTSSAADGRTEAASTVIQRFVEGLIRERNA